MLIFLAEEVETPIGPLMLDHGVRQLAESVHPGAGIGEGGDELQVAVVGSTPCYAQNDMSP